MQILADNERPKWLGEQPTSEMELLALLKPCPDDVLRIWPIDEAVGNVRNNNGPQPLKPMDAEFALG